MKALSVFLVCGLVGVGVASAATDRAGGGAVAAKPATFDLNNAQAQEVATVVGFVRAYNNADLQAALTYVRRGPLRIAAGDCDYRRHATVTYWFRKGLVQWLRQRFADHDHLTISRVYDLNPAQPVGVIDIVFSRRTSDTLRRLGYPNGIVPQIDVKLPPFFEGGVAKLGWFYLASANAPRPNPECALVAAPPRAEG